MINYVNKSCNLFPPKMSRWLIFFEAPLRLDRIGRSTMMNERCEHPTFFVVQESTPELEEVGRKTREKDDKLTT